MMIAVAGQFDRQLADFIRRAKKNRDLRIAALGHRRYPDLPVASWRLGSLVSAVDVAGMLEQVDVLVYFCMTPPSARSTDEGWERDVALCAAANIAAAAKKYPGLRVVLVTRAVHGIRHARGSACDYWMQIDTIFKGAGLSLAVVRTDPVISECDVVTAAVYERALRGFERGGDLFGVTRPVKKLAFYGAVEDAVMGRADGDVRLEGPCAVSFLDWLDACAAAARRTAIRSKLAVVREALRPESRFRAEMLDEVMRDAPAAEKCDDGRAGAAVLAGLRAVAEDIAEDDGAMKSYLLAPERSRPGGLSPSACYVQRVLTRPTRPVSEVADILMGWIPRYFQNLVSVETMSPSRALCRVARVPVVEFEKIVESPNRCRLVIRNQWFGNLRSPASFVVTTTGTEKDPGVLLVIVEDAPRLRIVLQSFRAMMIAFGRYLKDYGCGE